MADRIKLRRGPKNKMDLNAYELAYVTDYDEERLYFNNGRMVPIPNNKDITDIKNELTESKNITTQNINEINTNINNLDSTKATKTELQQESTNIKKEIATERARIDAFTQLPSGSTSGDAELIDARTNSEGNTFNNIGKAMRNVDSLLKSNVLNNNIIADFNNAYVMEKKDDHNMVFIEYQIKKDDIYEVTMLCECDHCITMLKAYPLDRSLSNHEFFRELTNTVSQTFIADDNYVGFLVWAERLELLQKVNLKKLNVNNNILKSSNIGTINDFVRSKVILNKTVKLNTNLCSEELNLKKGKYYRVNISTLTTANHSLVLSNSPESKLSTDTNIVANNKITADVIFTPIIDYTYARFWVNEYTNNTIIMKVEEIEFNFNNKREHDNLIYVAANNSSYHDKQIADLVCTGENDQDVINKAIELLTYGGTLKLLDGDYYIDTFNSITKSAIYIGDSGHSRVVNIVGTTENKGVMSEYGVTLHVTDKAWSKLDDNTQYSVINSVDLKNSVYDWYNMQNNANFENFYIYFPDNQKKVIGINGYNLGSMQITQVGIYDSTYWSDRYGHVKPTPAVEGCIGVLCPRTPNDEMARIGLDIVNVGGLHTGIKSIGIEHLIIRKCTISRGTYAFHFVGKGEKTLTLINCADEGNTHLWKFEGTGHLTAIDICIERLNQDYIPLDINGDTDPYAHENIPKGWRGFISYVIQGDGLGLKTFWKPGGGLGFKTINLDHLRCGTLEQVTKNPEFMEKYYATDLNKPIVWNGSKWIDTMGNAVS